MWFSELKTIFIPYMLFIFNFIFQYTDTSSVFHKTYIKNSKTINIITYN